MRLSRYVLGARRLSVGVASVAALGLLVALPGSAQAAAIPVPLGTADSFVVLAGSTITNTGATTVNGDMGLTPGTSITGMPPLVLNGASHVADTVALAAQADLGAAFDNAAGQTPATAIPNELGGSTLVPGIYSSGAFTITGTVTLDAGNNPNAIFVFQSAATLSAASGSRVNLINGASPCNVFWLVKSSATLNTTAAFKGTILALTDIHLFTGATVDGRVLARNGAVTLDANTITRPTCQATPTPTPTATPTATPMVTPAVISPSPQVTAVPSGPVAAGDGSTNGGGNNGLGLLTGVLAIAGVGGATVVAVRRRRLNV